MIVRLRDRLLPAAPVLDRAPAIEPGRATADHYRAVDGLRAVAVIAVMVFHLREGWLPGGLTGVDVFFVISGFVVTASVAQRQGGSFGDFVLAFYARRIARILPALALTVAVSAIAYALFIPSAWLGDTIAKTGLAAIFGLSNLVLAAGDDYFSVKAAFNVFTHTWSLGVEEQFYLLFPLIMYFGSKDAGAAGPRDRRVPILLALVAASFAAGALLSATRPTIAFYTLPARFWELGAGMLLCLTRARWTPWLAGAPRVATVIAAASAALLAAAFVEPLRFGFPVPWALLPVLGTLGLIAVAVASPATPVARLLATAPCVGTGRISYALYLWHWPVYVLMRWTVGLETAAQGLVAVAATVALATLSYRTVEMPARAWQRANRHAPAAVVRAGLAVALVLAVATGGMLKFKSAFMLGGTRDLATWYPEGRYTVPPQAGCAIAKQVVPRPDGVMTILRPTGCGTPAQGGRLIVAGDSHVGAYERMLWNYAYATGREVRTYWLAGCPMIGLRQEPATGACAAFEARLADELAEVLTPADIVFLPSLRLPRYVEQWGDSGYAAAASGAPDPDAVAVARSHLRRIAASGARIVFEAPKPLFKAPPMRCADWFNATNPVCAPGFAIDRSELEALRAPILARMAAAMRDLRQVSIWDPFPILCPETTCRAFRDGRPLLFDGDHVSGYANDVLLPSFAETMEAAFAAAAPRSSAALPAR